MMDVFTFGGDFQVFDNNAPEIKVLLGLMPEVEVISVGDGPAIAAGDAVFAAVAASAWLNRGCPVELPAG